MMGLMNDVQSRKPIGDEPHDIQTLHVDLNNSRLPTARDVSGDSQDVEDPTPTIGDIELYDSCSSG